MYIGIKGIYQNIKLLFSLRNMNLLNIFYILVIPKFSKKNITIFFYVKLKLVYYKQRV